jgi:hypothetical protein
VQKRRFIITDNRAQQIRCYHPEYTFVEKLQTISTKVRKQQATGEFGANFLRHFYDIHQLYQQKRIQDFIQTPDYQKHKAHRFKQQDALDLTVNLAFNLDKQTAIFQQYEAAYDKIQALFFSPPPSFETIYASITALREIG